MLQVIADALQVAVEYRKGEFDALGEALQAARKADLIAAASHALPPRPNIACSGCVTPFLAVRLLMYGFVFPAPEFACQAKLEAE
jgi:hypothetical protein